jgi:hypothetical protein
MLDVFNFERFVVLTMVGKKIMTLCRFVGGYQHLRVTCVLHLHSRRPLVLKMKAVDFFKYWYLHIELHVIMSQKTVILIIQVWFVLIRCKIGLIWLKIGMSGRLLWKL